LQVEGVRITDGAGGILVEVASPRPSSPTALDLAQATRGLTVAVGLDQWRRPVVVNLRDNPALLFVGPTRRGKTSAMKGAAYALASRNRPADVGFVVLSQKREDWTIFEPASACFGLVSDPADVVDVLQWAAGDLLQKRAKEGGSKPAFVFVVDDLVNLLKRRPDVADPLGEIASMGGGLGLFLFVGTHDAGSKRGTGGADVEANITARVVFKSSSATTAARAAGAGGLGVERGQWL
jgi:DNA segregation ATPase FtsK/SpoIIIE-like protein